MSDEVRIYFDTEATGLPIWGGPISALRQPYVVQLAWLVTRAQRTLEQGNFILHPSGVDEVPTEASDIHGVTTEMMLRHGQRPAEVLWPFLHSLKCADRSIAHNIAFDQLLIAIQLSRLGVVGASECDEETHAREGKAEAFALFPQPTCTMELATPVLKMAPTIRMIRAGHGDRFKSPKLAQAHKRMTGRKLEDAHNAMVDVEACRVIYEHLVGERGDGPVQHELEI